MNWRQWISDPPKDEDYPLYLAWNVGRPDTNINYELQVDLLSPGVFIEPNTFWLSQKDLLATLPKSLP